MNSGPLSDRMNAGEPRRMNRSVRASITFVEFSFRSTLMAKHSRLLSEMDDCMAAEIGPQMLQIAKEKYTWDAIGRKYFDLLD